MREMKDSGIEGIGEIPSDWKLSYLQYYADIVRGGSPRPIENICQIRKRDIIGLK